MTIVPQFGMEIRAKYLQQYLWRRFTSMLDWQSPRERLVYGGALRFITTCSALVINQITQFMALKRLCVVLYDAVVISSGVTMITSGAVNSGRPCVACALLQRPDTCCELLFSIIITQTIGIPQNHISWPAYLVDHYTIVINLVPHQIRSL